MNKPSDYSTYFNEDGTEKECPYNFGTEKYRPWLHRANEITYSLMNAEEKKQYREFRRHLTKKWEHPIGF